MNVVEVVKLVEGVEVTTVVGVVEEGCRVSVWAHLCPSGPPLFIIPNKLTPHGTGYSQCVPELG